MKSKLLTYLIVLGMTFIAFSEEPAQTVNSAIVPADVQYPLFIKILSFNKTFIKKPGDTCQILIISDSTDKESTQMANEFIQAHDRSNFKKVMGKNVILDQCSQMADLDSIIHAKNPDALFISSLEKNDLKNILKISSRNKVITITGIPEYVKHGVTVGLQRLKDHPSILINLKSASLAGAEFSSKLLKLATIIEQ